MISVSEMNRLHRESVISGSGSSGTAGGVSIETGTSTGTTMFTPQPDSSFRMAIYEPPELMINLCTSEFEERPDEELHTRRIRQEDSNATLTSTVQRFFDDIAINQLAESRFPNIAASPLSVYLYPENFQLQQQLLTHFTQGFSPSKEKVKRELHATTNIRFNNRSTNFDIRTVGVCPAYYLMLKEEVLISSLEQFLDPVNNNVSESDVKSATELALLCIRSGLMNKYFVTLFLKERIYNQLLQFVEQMQLLKNNDSMLLNLAQIMNLLLGRSLKYKSFKYNYSVLVVKQGQMVKTGRFGSETDKRISAYLDEALHKPVDGDAFESFKSDTEFWRMQIAPLVRPPSIDNHMGMDMWSQGEAYVIFELLSKIVKLHEDAWDAESIERVFKLCDVGFERLGAGTGKLPVAPSRDSGYGSGSESAGKTELEHDKLADRKLTMYFRIVKLVLLICNNLPSHAKASRGLLVEFVQKFYVTRLLFDKDLKSKNAKFYPFCEVVSKDKMRSDSPDSSVKKLHTISHQMLTDIYHQCFLHFYESSIRHLLNPKEMEQRKVAIMKNFVLRSQNWELRKQRIRAVMDFESLEEEEYVRQFTLDALDYFIKNTSDAIIGKLCDQHNCPVPMVKTCYYTTEFVLNKLGLQKESDPETKRDSDYYFNMLQSELLTLDFEHTMQNIKRNQKHSRTTRKPLYSFFFSTLHTPQKTDLYNLILNLLDNFIMTFVYGKPSERKKHFYKVIAFERTVIEAASEITDVTWPSTAVQSPNSKEFLEKIKYDKVSNIGNIGFVPKERESKNEELMRECRNEAAAIWEEQCLNYCTSKEVSCSCKYKELEQYDAAVQQSGSITFKLSADRQKLVYKLTMTSKGKIREEETVENSVMIKSCKFSMQVSEKTVKLIVAMDDGNQQVDLSSSHFPIHIEESVGKGNVASDSDPAAHLIYFSEALRTVLTASSQQMTISPVNNTSDDLKRYCKKLEKRKELEDNIAELLHDTRTFPVNCLPIVKKKGPAPPLPPLPSSLPAIEQNTCEF